MKTLKLIGLFALLSTAAACTARTDPTGSGASPISPGSCTALAAPAPGVPAPGLADPAAVYCQSLGYQAAGEQCAFPDGTSCEHWAFYRGQCGAARSFCNLHGGQVSSKTENMGTWTAVYAVCTLASGQQCKEDAFAHGCECKGESKPNDTAPADTALPAPQVANPASAYCSTLGYQATGEQCVFPDGTSCEQWSFYRGKCGAAHSFCNLHGGQVSSKTEDMGGWTSEYAVCSKGGKECKEDAFAQSGVCE